ncbi:MAG: FKBP-type peptidyl-prolyl cis-trans isomerase [Neisseria sp.]|nr:FKBP-type peptidyl-prolyl cis-trans isomerase [Neisseria sp.]
MKKGLQLSVLALAAALSLAACKQETASAPAASAASTNKDAAALGTPAQQASYAMGADIGRNLKQMKDLGAEIDLNLFKEALENAANGKELKLTEQQAQEIQMTFMQDLQTKAAAKEQADSKANAEKGKTFLAENAKKAGVKTTASGLQYQVKKEGTGKQPKATDVVSVTYAGRLIDGTEFDSSKGETVSFPLNQVIKGWTEGLQLMKEGGEYTFFIPAELAYGDQGNPRIPAGSTLIFDVKLVKVGQ